ncbi:MAG: hypothetical protein AAF608_05250 [Pseudomonadota bacterium]
MNYRGALIAAAVAMMGKGRPIALLPLKLQQELKAQQVPLTEVQQAYDNSLLMDFARAALFETEETLHSFGLPDSQLDVAFLLRDLCDIQLTGLINIQTPEDDANG